MVPGQKSMLVGLARMHTVQSVLAVRACVSRLELAGWRKGGAGCSREREKSIAYAEHERERCGMSEALLGLLLLHFTC